MVNSDLQTPKWFIYLGNHHEGPFTTIDVRDKLASGQITPNHYAWCEGMTDWKVYREIAELSGESAESPGSEVKIDNTTVVSAPEPGPQAVEAQSDLTQLGISPQAEDRPQPAPTASAPAKAKRSFKISRGLIYFMLFAALIGAGGSAYLQGWISAETFDPVVAKVLAWVPQLSVVLSPISRLDDVSKEDYEELKQAALTAPNPVHPFVAVALSKADPTYPAFYIASHTADGAAFDVWVVGVSDTLLNTMSFSGKLPVTTIRKLGKTPALKTADGKLVPRGEYWVIVGQRKAPENVPTAEAPKIPAEISAVLPNDFEPLTKKLYFLGGAKDATYTARLKEYHDRLKAKVASEIDELKQFSQTLESQLESTNKKYQSLHRGKVTSVHRKVWNGFHGSWSALTGKLVQTAQSWNPAALEHEYFHGALYKQVQEAAVLVSRAHELEHSYFTGTGDPKSLDVQIGEVSARAQHILSEVKAKIAEAEQVPTTPNGMPRKEGT